MVLWFSHLVNFSMQKSKPKVCVMIGSSASYWSFNKINDSCLYEGNMSIIFYDSVIIWAGSVYMKCLYARTTETMQTL